jgi:hypothetical protein
MNKLLSQLRRIRKELKSRFSGFPNNCCTGTVIELNERLGLPIQAGYLYNIKHAWNTTIDEKYIIDLTASQCTCNPDIQIIPIGESIKRGYVIVPEARDAVLSLQEGIRQEKRLDMLLVYNN